GTQKRCFVIHRSSIGAIERIMAFLIEKYAGAFPLWLSPVQVKVLSVSEKHAVYAQEVAATLKAAGIRVEADDSNESLGKKIRNAKTEKIPYLLVVGDAEVEAKTVSVDIRGGSKGQSISMGVDAFIRQTTADIKSRNADLSFLKLEIR